MKNKISVYDLLGLIKDGKAPKMIRIFEDSIYVFDEYNNFYYNNGFSLYRMFYDLGNALEERVEILEDKPTIDKISINGKDIHKLEELGIYDVIENIESTLNEIIDKLEKESK